MVFEFVDHQVRRFIFHGVFLYIFDFNFNSVKASSAKDEEVHTRNSKVAIVESAGAVQPRRRFLLATLMYGRYLRQATLTCKTLGGRSLRSGSLNVGEGKGCAAWRSTATRAGSSSTTPADAEIQPS